MSLCDFKRKRYDGEIIDGLVLDSVRVSCMVDSSSGTVHSTIYNPSYEAELEDT